MIVVCLLVLCMALMVPESASARDTSARKFSRGVSNIGLGVLAIPGQIVRTTKDNGPFVGATWGFLKGVGFMAATEVIGIYELLTCPFEAPPDFKAILKPEFPWQYFSESR
jgi:putative exosortase-associated protein (TIGR04073 family)